jgi:hypothetical protein
MKISIPIPRWLALWLVPDIDNRARVTGSASKSLLGRWIDVKAAPKN